MSVIEVEEVTSHGVSAGKKIVQVSAIDVQEANVYRPTFSLPAEGFLSPISGKAGHFQVRVAEDGPQNEGSKTMLVKALSVDGSKAGASIRVHRDFVRVQEALS